MWSELAKDAGGIVLFLIWLVLPLVYVVALGRRYVRQARDAAQEATCANEEVQEALDDLYATQTPQECTQPTVPAARTEEDTWRLPPVEPPERAGKHRLDPSRLAPKVASCPR
ncbi:hypothetical protein SK803_22390 [Lentzea sp. BCCO 10_0856]|uniref:Uncharacterized protein n=1 Tax=Lentzea miocenica TaxID=3095431 RepID=A0ABU4T498_9PSEU|nr:hypothetical protein [Lentzea sp. BCCO 10_0856]MDX8032977.1 hypothetical protein [Lentzea sp. BCCO 10_0856]